MYYSNRLAQIPLPSILKFLLLGIVGTSVVTTLWTVLAPAWLQFFNPAMWLTLSLHGVKQWFFWQNITYVFIEPLLSVNHLLHVFFTLYLLYSIGMSFLAMRSQKELATVFVGGALAAGLAGTCSLLLYPSPSVLMGPMPAIYALVVAWIFLYPQAELYLLLTFPMKARWLFLAIAGIGLFSDLADQQYARFFSYLAALSFGYFYALLKWEIHSPFPFLRSFETSFVSFKKRLFKTNVSVHNFSKDPKIYDFKTGKAVLKDEEFLDACLEKISRLGKGSLSLWERFRLWQIHKKRKQRQS